MMIKKTFPIFLAVFLLLLGISFHGGFAMGENTTKILIPSLDELKSGQQSSVSQLYACVIAYERFRSDGLPAGSIQLSQYNYSVFQSGKIIFVHFSPDLDSIKGTLFGGAVTYGVDSETSKVVIAKHY